MLDTTTIIVTFAGNIQQSEGQETLSYSFYWYFDNSSVLMQRESICPTGKVFGYKEHCNHRKKRHQHQQIDTGILYSSEAIQGFPSNQHSNLDLFQIRKKSLKCNLEMA